MTSAEKSTDPVDDLFGEPPLLKGEDKAHMRLRAAVEAEIEPTGFFERMNVIDQTNKLWRRCAAAAMPPR